MPVYFGHLISTSCFSIEVYSTKLPVSRKPVSKQVQELNKYQIHHCQQIIAILKEPFDFQNASSYPEWIQ